MRPSAVRPFGAGKPERRKEKLNVFPTFRPIFLISAFAFHSIACCVALLCYNKSLSKYKSVFLFSFQLLLSYFNRNRSPDSYSFAYFYKNQLLEKVSTNLTVYPLRLIVLCCMAHDKPHRCGVHCLHPIIHH